jgi:HAD superfamily hydrolase (TIGR01509 family)
MRLSPAIRWIFWDNDGVLVDTERLYYRATREVLATVGVELTEEMFVELFLIQARGAWHIAAERGVTPEEIEQLRERRARLYSELLGGGRVLLPGVPETLERLRGRVRMGIVTSSRRDHFEIIHRSTGLLEFFDFVVTADECSRLKPEPEPYLRALSVSGATPESCLVVEDTLRGLSAARAAGLCCWVIPSHFMPNRDFAGADRILRGIEEIEP